MSQDLFEQFREAHTVLVVMLDRLEPLSPRDMVERALLLTLTNPTATEKDLARSFASEFGSHGMPYQQVIDHVERPNLIIGSGRHTRQATADEVAKSRKGWKLFIERWWKEIAEQRKWFRGALESIVRDPAAARARLTPDIEAGLREILPVARLVWDGHHAREEVFYVAPSLMNQEFSIAGVITLALTRILDESGKLAKALKVCRLHRHEGGSCDRIFLSFPPPGGGPRPEYCTPDHRLAASKLTGAERMQRYREKKLDEKQRPRPRKRK